jgi:hypothetical protein
MMILQKRIMESFIKTLHSNYIEALEHINRLADKRGLQ